MATDIKKYLGKQVEITVDRPLGSLHPEHGFKYLANYGYVPGTISPDGEEIDAYVLGVDVPLVTFKGFCVAIIHRFSDDDDKLVVVAEDKIDISNEEIRNLTYFQEQFSRSEIVRL